MTQARASLSRALPFRASLSRATLPRTPLPQRLYQVSFRAVARLLLAASR